MYWFTYFSAVVQMSNPYEQFSDPNIHKQFKNNRTKLIKPKLFGNKHEHLSVWFLLILHECMVIIELTLQNAIFVMIKDKDKEPGLDILWAICKHFVEKVSLGGTTPYVINTYQTPSHALYLWLRRKCVALNFHCKNLSS